MDTKLIGVDIDCVLCKTDKKLDAMGFKRESEEEYHYTGLKQDFFHQNPAFYEDLEEVEGAAVSLRKVSESHDIIYISHRDDSAYEITKTWLKEHGFPEAPGGVTYK